MKNVIFFCIVCFIISSCGYKHTPQKLKNPVKLYISYFQNETQEPRLHEFFTEFLKDQFIKRKDTFLVSAPERADLIIKGKILKFNYYGVSFSIDDRSLEFRASMTVQVTLIDKNGVTLKTKDFYEYKEFKTGLTERFNSNIDVGKNENLKTIIYKKISILIAEDIYDWMFAGF